MHFPEWMDSKFTQVINKLTLLKILKVNFCYYEKRVHTDVDWTFLHLAIKFSQHIDIMHFPEWMDSKFTQVIKKLTLLKI